MNDNYYCIISFEILVEFEDGKRILIGRILLNTQTTLSVSMSLVQYISFYREMLIIIISLINPFYL